MDGMFKMQRVILRIAEDEDARSGRPSDEALEAFGLDGGMGNGGDG